MVPEQTDRQTNRQRDRQTDRWMDKLSTVILTAHVHQGFNGMALCHEPFCVIDVYYDVMWYSIPMQPENGRRSEFTLTPFCFDVDL